MPYSFGESGRQCYSATVSLNCAMCWLKYMVPAFNPKQKAMKPRHRVLWLLPLAFAICAYITEHFHFCFQGQLLMPS